MAVPDISQIQPAATPEAAPATAPAAQQDPFLQGLAASPVIQSVQQGNPGAIFAPPSIFGDHAADVIPKLIAGIGSLNLAVVEAPKSGNLVVYNPQVISPQAITEADAQGKLESVATPLVVTHPPSKKVPVPNVAPAAPAPQAAAPQPSVNVIPPTSGVAGAGVATQRANNIIPKPPSQQANPGLGIVNGLQKRAF